MTIEKGLNEFKAENRRLFIEVANRVEALRLIKEGFIATIKERFGPESGDPLDYHKVKHSLDVAKRTVVFLKVIQEIDPDLVSTEDIERAEIEGLGHDLVQRAFKEPGKFRERWRGAYPEDITPEMRKRGVEIGNEHDSALEIIAEFKRYRLPDGAPVFNVTQEFIKETVDDIAATFPKFEFNAELPDGTTGIKVFQPYLSLKSSLRALGIASGDLRGDLAEENPAVFIETGNGELRELNDTIKQDLRKGIDNIGNERRADIVGSILDWQKSQPGHGKWQKELYRQSIEENEKISGSLKAEEIKKALYKLYGITEDQNGAFDRTIAAAQQHYENMEARFGHLRGASVWDVVPEEREKLEEQFIKLLEAVGYEL
jgi:hypothetical protein